MSTTKRTLVDLVLTASFRRERHSGLLLTDPLPDELPIDGTVEAQEAWGNLVSLQRRFIDVRAPDPWGFSDAIRQLHDALGKRFRDHDAQRPYMLSDLRFGPWGLTDEGASDWSVHTEGFVGRAFASDDEDAKPGRSGRSSRRPQTGTTIGAKTSGRGTDSSAGCMHAKPSRSSGRTGSRRTSRRTAPARRTRWASWSGMPRSSRSTSPPNSSIRPQRPNAASRALLNKERYQDV